jgi:hypothetical protein
MLKAHCTDTPNNVQHGEAARIQLEDAALKCTLDVQQGHISRTCSMDMPDGHAA